VGLLVNMHVLCRTVRRDKTRFSANASREGPIFCIGVSLVIANEFFDALPVHQFVHTERGWCEKLIDIDEGEGYAFHCLQLVLDCLALFDPLCLVLGCLLFDPLCLVLGCLLFDSSRLKLSIPHFSHMCNT